MLIFQDIRKLIFERVNEVHKTPENDVYVDPTGHSDFTVRVFRLINQPDGREKIEKMIEKIRTIENISGAKLENGYINIYLDKRGVLRYLLDYVEKYGKYPDTFQEPERVSVEHTSANPTGPLHIGRARNSIIGDSISRLLGRFGYRVTKQYFVNDSGKQMLSLYTAYEKYNGPMTMDNLLQDYQKIYKEIEKDKSVEEEIENNLMRYERADPNIYGKLREIAGVMLQGITGTLAKVWIGFDEFNWESDFIRSGEVEKAIESVNPSEEGGAKYIEVGGRKVFLTRSDGTTLYFSRDIAYHLYKAQNFDWIINVLGEDHKEHGKLLEHVMKGIMNIESKMSFVYYSFITLESGKMSTRRGNIVTLEDLIERTFEEALRIVREKRPDLEEERMKEIAKVIASSSIRFNIIRVSAPKPITFRWDEALNFEGNSAPFIMYTYARGASIIKKKERDEKDFSTEMDHEEEELVRQMYLYPYVLSDAAQNLRPDIIAGYLIDLAQKFNDFYKACRVIGAPDGVYDRRIRLIETYMKIVEDAGDILGIKMLEEI
ncbi:tRNA synthetase Arg [Thermoplasma volcanium GSS1]|uniref:Arginine--tRNA ligase n=1 Tax=Thermoplasma volcanium (strain ATCC 51530 / DSM 4299 / JCM 9571 / NBRC 15438 / GSS1) TaxID=273116 RepID=Q978S2_THEVO|nr:arginine--tRNA ligase [Thermoplasma volcanium]BAB60485.1 tRNA synthetase Arg [Thermoplasma volcanium GSS1]